MNHGRSGLLTPFPRDDGRLVLAPDDRNTELRIHETTPGYWSALRWYETRLGWCGALAHGLTLREWAAAGGVAGAADGAP